MANYDFSKAMEPERFQDFARDILQAREQNVMESFRKTKDGGIDMRTKKEGKLVIGQAKRYSNKKDLMKNLKNTEIQKVKKQNPDRYILITSIDYDDKTKKEIMELFEGYIQDEKDIIGNADLNNFLNLKGYENIEENYPELWFNSARIFEYILEKTVHRKIYNVSKEEFKKIKRNEKTYIENEIYEKAKQMLETYNCLLITGEAGIGKTSLARHICHEAVKNGYKFVYAYDVDDIWNNYTENKQIFFLDDFWGSIFKEQYDKTEEKKFQDMLETIQQSQNKKLVLTSREYIIEKGFREHPRIGDCLDETKMILKLKEYSEKYKAEIYLKHIQESELKGENKNTLIEVWQQVIQHPMYNPRLITEFIQKATRQIKIEKNYQIREQLFNYLDHPKNFIKDIFDEQTEVGKLLLVLLFLRNWEVEVEDLKSQYYEYIAIDNQMGKKEDFLVAMKQLSDVLIEIEEDKNFKEYYEVEEEPTKQFPVLVDFLNPSIQEFVYEYFTENLDKYSQTIIHSTTCLNTLMYLSGTYAFQLRGMKEYKLQIKEIQNMILDKIIKDYDKLEFRYRKDVMDSELELAQRSHYSELGIILEIYQNNKEERMKKFLEEKITAVLEPILSRKQKLNYTERVYFPGMLAQLIKTDIPIQLEKIKILEIYYQSIEYVDEFKHMEDEFKYVFPEEIEIFMKEYKKEIKDRLPKMLMQNAIYFKKMGYGRELENIIDIEYPYLLYQYDFKSSKRYESNLQYVVNCL